MITRQLTRKEQQSILNDLFGFRLENKLEKEGKEYWVLYDEKGSEFYSKPSNCPFDFSTLAGIFSYTAHRAKIQGYSDCQYAMKKISGISSVNKKKIILSKMEQNTVVITLKEYDKLRDFKKEVEESRKESKFAVIIERWGGFVPAGKIRVYYTESEIVADFEKRNNELEAKIRVMANYEKELASKLKKMSFWELLKWRKSK